MTLCASESFEVLSDGLQNAFWELRGTPRRQRSDSRSAAVNSFSAKRKFRPRYEAEPLRRAGRADQRASAARERRFGVVTRSLQDPPWIRPCNCVAVGTSPASTTQTFLRHVLDKRNAAHRERHAEEAALLRPLSATSLESRLCLAVIVAIDCLVHRNRDASRAIRACGRHGDVLPAQQKERASRAVAPLAFAFRARTIWNGSAAAWQSFAVA